VINLIEKASVALDHLQWRMQTERLRWASEPETSRSILFVDLHSNYSGAKVGAILAKALRREGWRTGVLLPARSRLFPATYNALGPVQRHFFEDFITDKMRSAAKSEAATLMQGLADFGDLLGLVLDGIHVGRYVASRVVRELRVGSIDMEDPDQNGLVQTTLIEALTALQAGAVAIESIAPDAALFNEKGYTPAGEFCGLCLERNIDVIQWGGSHDSGSLVFKRYNKDNHDEHTYALDPGTWSWVCEQKWTEEDDASSLKEIAAHYVSGSLFSRVELQQGKKMMPVEDVRSLLSLDETKRTAVIFSHIFYDATFFFGTSLYSNYEVWLIETVRAAIANPSLNWVIKMHPVNVWRSKMDGAPLQPLEAESIVQALGPLPDHVKLMPSDTPVNTYSLFPVIDYGLTVRGTVGIELAAHGIPVVTAGTGRYEGLGFTVDPADPDEYQETLRCLHEMPKLDVRSTELARRYSTAVFRDRLWPMSAFSIKYNVKNQKISHLKSNTRLHKKSLQRFAESEDLSVFTRWVDRRDRKDLFWARDRKMDV